MVAREREIGDGVVARYTLGSVPPRAYAALSDAASRIAGVEETAGAAGGAAELAVSSVAEIRAATGTAAGAGVPALATKEYVDGLFEGLVDLSEVEF
ncbi:hypothetical protein [Collinsella ihumii]|uniref:hypothetical protein n=1 Tax=Collinsella ihumii TaxID=1720204 RepID=UPI0025AAF4FE|nr:hypothetical protein [Collinsella ihumii]MDN0056362.1 hypothetical protein [Collinsella ihumii]